MRDGRPGRNRSVSRPAFLRGSPPRLLPLDGIEPSRGICCACSHRKLRARSRHTTPEALTPESRNGPALATLSAHASVALWPVYLRVAYISKSESHLGFAIATAASGTHPSSSFARTQNKNPLSLKSSRKRSPLRIVSSRAEKSRSSRQPSAVDSHQLSGVQPARPSGAMHHVQPMISVTWEPSVTGLTMSSRRTRIGSS